MDQARDIQAGVSISSFFLNRSKSKNHWFFGFSFVLFHSSLMILTRSFASWYPCQETRSVQLRFRAQRKGNLEGPGTDYTRNRSQRDGDLRLQHRQPSIQRNDDSCNRSKVSALCELSSLDRRESTCCNTIVCVRSHDHGSEYKLRLTCAWGLRGFSVKDRERSRKPRVFKGVE